MRVSHASLAKHTSGELSPVYLIFGSETLLVEECLDQLRTLLVAQGFHDRQRFTVESGFDWNTIFSGSQSLSLFAERKLIELRLPSGKPGDAGSKALVEYTAMPANPDCVLVIVSAGIEKRAQNSKWFKSIDTAGVVSECPTIPRDRLPDWIITRSRQQSIRIESEAAEKLAHFVEGNLLAAAQEINLLALLYPDSSISSDMLDGVIADHARFTTFGFVDACVAGSSSRAVRILQSLRRDQTEPILVLWSLTREIRTLCHLSAIAEQGRNPESMFQKFGIWRNRAGMVQSALRRLKHQHLLTLLRKLGQADLMLKGRQPLERESIWEEIEHIALGICRVRIP
ncbi:MAG: DNA polymerase III subunit delta [Pseudomonadota bacterium]